MTGKVVYQCGTTPRKRKRYRVEYASWIHLDHWVKDFSDTERHFAWTARMRARRLAENLQVQTRVVDTHQEES